MKVLVACEESQTVCKAFLERGHDAYSNDVIACGGGMKDRHIMMDALMVINGGVMKLENGSKVEIPKWDLIIAHPPCTFLTNCATRSHSVRMTPINWINGRMVSRIQAMDFFMRIINADCDRIAVENPVGMMNTVYRKPDQIFDPYQFAEGTDDKENYVTKRTCLWLKGLEPLQTNDLEKPNNHELFGTYKNGKAKVWEDTYSRDSGVRSKTFSGVARAMAEQWG